MRDFQRSKVYDWEKEVISPLDKSLVEYKDIQSIVDYIWDKEGYKYSPKVFPLARQNKKAFATGNRNKLHFKQDIKTPTWVIIHELSHSITCDIEGTSNRHGADFLGVYINLVAKYLNISFVMLTYTAEQAGLKYNLSAKAMFLD
jgi:hypothetical protein